MKYLLDTNAVIAVIRLDKTLVSRLNRHKPNDVCTSAIAVHELYFGAHKSARLAQNIRTLEDIGMPVLSFDQDDARISGDIRASLTAKGKAIGSYDMLIAGQALARDLTLITRNTREFSRVEGLRLENWQD